MIQSRENIRRESGQLPNIEVAAFLKSKYENFHFSNFLEPLIKNKNEHLFGTFSHC